VTTAAIDHFLALFVRQSVRGGALPPWPADWPQTPEFRQSVFDRIAFHGVALVVARQAEAFGQWPGGLREQVQGEARGQSFWELGHRQALARLVEALAAAGVAHVITKGTALAYTLYPEPAMRRRGDSDLLLPGAGRRSLRKVLAANGFRPVGDARPLQESWAHDCPMGFTHVFDLHWQSNASAVISHCFERAGIGSRTVPLPRISPAARAIAPTDNVILIAINRALHGQFGYITGADKAFEEDRLIWAMDFDLLCGSFGQGDWQALMGAVQMSGTAPVVLSALTFAQAALGTAIPAEIMAQLAAVPGDARLLRYLGEMSGMARLRLNLSACQGLTDKLRLTRYTLFPGAEVLHERFPKAAHWPIPALQVRRLLFGIGQLMQGRS
jgi:hypothetical protein